MDESVTEPKTFTAQEQADARAKFNAAKDDKERADLVAQFPFLENTHWKHFAKPTK